MFRCFPRPTVVSSSSGFLLRVGGKCPTEHFTEWCQLGEWMYLHVVGIFQRRLVYVSVGLVLCQRVPQSRDFGDLVTLYLKMRLRVILDIFHGLTSTSTCIA